MGSRKLIFVTGASRGIGRAIALAAARDNYDVAFTYRSAQAEAVVLVSQLQALGVDALAFAADGGDQAQTQRAFAAAEARFGRLDALVANAGIIGAPRSIVDVDHDHLAAVFRVNVLGTFFAISEAVRRMSVHHGGQGGAIVVMSSAAARHGGMIQEAHYAASKGALDSMTLSLAKELPDHGVRINALRPGVIRTAIHDIHGGGAAISATEAAIPLRRAGEPAEVADTAMFLLGPASAYVHGAILDVSGGR
jgi:NAD(P)-dependent dehydrogenase (short-subunit alcohol dehydrogenase family)